MRAGKEESLRVAVADVKTTGGMAKMISFQKLMSILRGLAIYLLVLIGVSAHAQGVPDDCTQLILGIAPTWNSIRGELRLLERSRGHDWTTVTGPFPVLFG